MSTQNNQEQPKSSIERIRKRSGLIIALIGLAIVGFLVSDVISSNSSLFSGGGRSSEENVNYLAMINDEELKFEEYDLRWKKLVTNQMRQMNLKEPDDELITQAKQQAWNSILNEKIVERQIQEIGLDITGMEIYTCAASDLANDIAQQFFLPNFKNQETGDINYAAAVDFITNIESQEEQNRQFWFELEEAIVATRAKEKLNALVKQSIFINDLEAADNYFSQNKSVVADYVPLFTSSLTDSSQFQVNDADIENYFNKNKEEYKQVKNRAIQYVTVDVIPTPQDSSSALEYINKQANLLRRENSNDTLYFMRNSTDFENRYRSIDEFPDLFKNQFFSSDSGTIIGPLYDAASSSYKFGKVISYQNNDSDLYYRASHILIRPEGNTLADTNAAMAKAVALMARARNGEDFAQLARDNSTDGSASQGGDLGWFKKGAMVKAFQDGVERTRKGDYTVVVSQFGAHVIKVTENPLGRKVKAGIYERKIVAGTSTERNAFNKISELNKMVNEGMDYEEAVQKLNFQIRELKNLSPDTRDVAGLPDVKELVRWAYNSKTKMGDVSEPIRLNDKIVVAKLTEASEEGYPNPLDIKDKILPLVISEKKKQILLEKFNSVLSNGANELSAIAKALEGSVVSASNINFSSNFVANLNEEPVFVGAAHGGEVNKVIGPFIGKDAVYVLQVKEVTGTELPKDLKEQREFGRNQSVARVESQLLDALKIKANIKDYRYLFN